MKREVLICFASGALALSGCAKKTAPETSGMLPPSDGVYDASSSDPTADDTARLQADLVASAGSDRVLFELDSSTLNAEARQTLTRQVAWLRQHPSVSFTIEGHCDERGTRDHNLALGDRRATSVANFLGLQGISPNRLRTISYGKERPEALGSDESSYAQNRRAVSIVLNASNE